MAKNLKKIGFNEAGSIRKATINVAGYEPFDITYKIPGNAARIAILVMMQSDEAKIGNAALDFIVEHMTAWTLPELISRESLNQLDNDRVFYEIFKTIKEAGESRKN